MNQTRIQCKNWKQFFDICNQFKIPKDYWDDTQIEGQIPSTKYEPVVLVIYDNVDKDKWRYCVGNCEQCKIVVHNDFTVKCLEEECEICNASTHLRKEKLERILK